MASAVDAQLRGRSAAASESHVAQAARDVLANANAVDAVVAGILMAAAESASVLLGPVQVLVSGAGAGLIAIDGRVRQPGLDAPRPRGFLATEPIPPAAHVGVPALPGAIATVLASLGSITMLRAAGPALAWVRSRSPARAELLEAIARRGARAIADEGIAEELTAIGGRAARGVLTPEDLAAVRPVVARCDERTLGARGLLTVPWRGEPLDGSTVHVVAAVDARGMAAVACYEVHLDGVAVDALGLVAPRLAVPVRRGEPRVAPGVPRPAASPIALRVRSGVVDLALGIAATPSADESLDAVTKALDEAPTIGEALALASGRAVAIACARNLARTIASA